MLLVSVPFEGRWDVCLWPVAAPHNKIARFAGWSFQIGDGGQPVPVP
jgi:hypothetical protein